MSDAASRPGRLSRWLAERARLYREWERISEVETEAWLLVDELRARRDGQQPKSYDLSALKTALSEVHGA